MKDGLPVWFGCDVGKRSVRDGGVMDLNALDLETLFNTEFTMDKSSAPRLRPEPHDARHGLPGRQSRR